MLHVDGWVGDLFSMADVSTVYIAWRMGGGSI